MNFSFLTLFIKIINECLCFESADVSSLNGYEGLSRSSNASLRDANHRDHIVNVHSTSSNVRLQKHAEVSEGNSARNSVNELATNSNSQVSNSENARSDGSSNEAKQPVFLDEISSSVDEGSGKDEGLLDNCGILPANCLPCLASTVPTVEKRRSGSSSPPRSLKKATSKLSFKWRDGHAHSTLRESYTTQLSFIFF